MLSTPIIQSDQTRVIKSFSIPSRWCVHSYYSLCPYAPDGSGRILLAGTDIDSQRAEIIILDEGGKILDRFGSSPVTPSFWHTGLWQSWSPDAQQVYYQSGTHLQPTMTRHDLRTGIDTTIQGDIEGMPPLGEPAFSCSHSMLYAAGYGGNGYNAALSPVPFQERSRHGIYRIQFEPESSQLALSTQEIIQLHPLRDKIHEADLEIKKRLGDQEGLTLMTYCVRWSPNGERMLFFFGNHCIVKDRAEPKVTSVFTADRNLENIHLAIDLSFEKRGVHWSWQADNEHLIGYGPDPDYPGKQCLAEVRYDGTGYRKLSKHDSGGHPSTSPANPDLIVTDECSEEGGNVVFISKSTGDIIDTVALPKFIGEREPAGRNPFRVCHHPVFNQSGDRILCNSLIGKHATLVELDPPQY